MARKIKKRGAGSVRRDAYGAILREVVGLHDEARRTAARSVNAVMTATYWQIGKRIVEAELGGRARAGYGAVLVARLSADLTGRFGRGFGKSNLYQMRNFYIAHGGIFQTPSGKWKKGVDEKIFQMMSGKSQSSQHNQGQLTFPLPWSHYVRLMSVENPSARLFYETEALRGGWTVKQLDRQIGTMFY